MKNTRQILLSLFLAAFAAGCKPADEKSTADQIDKLKTETKAAAEELKEKDFTYAQKAEFTAHMQSQLADISRNLDQLEAKIEKSSDTIKVEANPKLIALREQTARLNKQLDEVKNATESTWDSVKTTSRKAFEDLKEGFQKGRQWVSDKIAP